MSPLAPWQSCALRAVDAQAGLDVGGAVLVVLRGRGRRPRQERQHQQQGRARGREWHGADLYPFAHTRRNRPRVSTYDSSGTRMIGQTLSHYRILSPLGRGAMGEVFAAEDVRLGRRVAVKLLPAELGSDPAATERFQREARIVSSLNHPNICTLYDIGEHQGRHFMVMELLDGEPLVGAARRAARWPLDQVLTFGGDVAGALDAAHRQGVVHRDIKPANLFVTTAAPSRCSTSASPSSASPRAAPRRPTAANTSSPRSAPPSARWPTCRRSRPAARTSTPAATCSRSASCSTRWPPAARRFPARRRRRSSRASSPRRRRRRRPSAPVCRTASTG